MCSTLLNCFCFTKIILTASSTDIFSQVISGFVLHIKELCPIVERFTALLADNWSLSIGGEFSMFSGRHGGWLEEGQAETKCFSA
jgi:hypothetical protein